MIDTSRLTESELDVLAVALVLYRNHQAKRLEVSDNEWSTQDATWRIFECDRLSASLFGR